MQTGSAGKKSRYAYLLGEDISHSLSPAIHNAAFAALGLDCEFGLLDVPPSRLPEALARLREADCLGANITMPYKSTLLAVAEESSETVKRCGAASIVINHEGRLSLHNNDVEAITACLKRRAATIARGSAVIVGAGGSAAAMLESLRRIPPSRVFVLARRPDQAKMLVERVRDWMPFSIEVGHLSEGGKPLADASLIFNATPLGVREGDPSPIPRAVLRPGLLIYDIVYRREGPTRLQRDAVAAGALICDGVRHIYEQAPFTFRMLTGHEAPSSVMLQTLRKATGREPLEWGSDPRI